jgi:hypothetical protein
MIVHDFEGTHRVHSIAELEQRLGVRFNDEENGFGLSPDSSEYPLLLIQVRGNLAVIHYIPGDGEAGYESLGGKMNLDPHEKTTFSIHRSGDEIYVLNRFIVPFSEALEVAKEFFQSQALPRSIKWLKL